MMLGLRLGIAIGGGALVRPWVYVLGDGSFALTGSGPWSITVTGGPLAGTYELEAADYASGPAVLAGAYDTGTETEGSTLTANPGLAVAPRDDGPVTWVFQWFRGATVLTTGATHTVTADDLTLGLNLRWSVTNAAGTTVSETVAIAEPSYTEAGVTFVGTAHMTSSAALAGTNPTQLVFVASFIAKLGQDVPIAGATTGILSIQVNTSGVLRAGWHGWTGSSERVLIIDSASGTVAVDDRVDVLLGFQVSPALYTIAYRINGGAWVSLSSTNILGATSWRLSEGVLYIGGRSQFSNASTDLTIYRLGLYTDTFADMTDSASRDVFFGASALKDPAVAEATHGAPLMLFDGADGATAWTGTAGWAATGTITDA